MAQEDLKQSPGRPLTQEETDYYLDEKWESGVPGRPDWMIENLQFHLKGLGYSIDDTERGAFGPQTRAAFEDAKASGESLPGGWMEYALDAGYSDPRLIETHGEGLWKNNYTRLPSDVIGMSTSKEKMEETFPSVQGRYYDPHSPESMGKYKRVLSYLASAPESSPGKVELPQAGKESGAPQTATVNPATRSAAQAALEKILGGAAPEPGPLLKKRQAAAVAAQRLADKGPKIEGMGGIIEELQAQGEAFPDDPSQAEWSRGHDFSGGEATMGQLAKAPKPMPEGDMASDQNFEEAIAMSERWGDTLSSGAGSDQIRDQTDIVDMLVARRKPDTPVYNQVRDEVAGSGNYPDLDPKLRTVSLSDEDPATKIDPLPSDFDPSTTFGDEVGDTFSNADSLGMANIRNAMATAASDKKEKDWWAEQRRGFREMDRNTSLEERYGEPHPEELERVRLHEGLKDGDKIREKYPELGELGKYLESKPRPATAAPAPVPATTAPAPAAESQTISESAKEKGQAVADSMMDELTQGLDYSTMLPALKRFETEISGLGQRGTALDKIESAIKGSSSARQLNALDPVVRNAINDETNQQIAKSFANYVGDATATGTAGFKAGRAKAKVKMELKQAEAKARAALNKETREMEKASRQKKKDIATLGKMTQDREIGELRRAKLNQELEKLKREADEYEEFKALRIKNLKAQIAQRYNSLKKGGGGKTKKEQINTYHRGAKDLIRMIQSPDVLFAEGVDRSQYKSPADGALGSGVFAQDMINHLNSIVDLAAKEDPTQEDLNLAKDRYNKIFFMYNQVSDKRKRGTK